MVRRDSVSYSWEPRPTSRMSQGSRFHGWGGGERSAERGRLMSGGRERGRLICWRCWIISSLSDSSWAPVGSIERRVEGCWFSIESVVSSDSPICEFLKAKAISFLFFSQRELMLLSRVLLLLLWSRPQPIDRLRQTVKSRKSCQPEMEKIKICTSEVRSRNARQSLERIAAERKSLRL